ncbi:MAG: SIS domain-containing protein [Symbiobacterium sp.]|uniref:SIS domain-containing protein n=1 Tax=Symbiobacterium sp. TaxID=1971213 RepID=UPI003463F3EA
MATDFDRNEFLANLETAVREKGRYADLAARIAREKGINRLYLIGCGAPNRQMGAVKYLVESVARKLEVHLYFPAEFVEQNPPKIDEHTLVILGSHSGTTPEVVRAAKFLQGKPCTVMGITQKADSPLAQNVEYPVLYGESKSGYFAMYILLQALVGAVLKEIEGWADHDEVMASLDAFPAALADAIEQSEARVTEEARLYKDDKLFFVIGSGPCFSTAYVYGVCILTEMQWLTGIPVEAAEWFHGPFELFDEKLPAIIVLGEDASRPLAERVVRFCKRYSERLMIYDSKDFEMKGVAPVARPLFAPFILSAALDRQAEHLAVWHNHPLSTRRYMWKTEY